MSGRASGTDAGKSNGDAKSRAHHDGSAGRAYTIEQKAAVLRVRRCGATAFYDILGLEEVKSSCSESDIKKAYRKLSLLTHPDKNGYDGADEAFKMVSRAFQVLSDAEKKSKFDKFGGDPESRTAQASNSGFSGFARPQGGGGPFGGFGGFEEGPEISPEELFRQFFGGGFGGGRGGGGFPGMFDTGPGFVFNMGGPGVRVHQFGGGAPRRRPREAGEPAAEGGSSIINIIFQLLPLFLLFILPLLSSLFTGGSSYGPTFRLDKALNPHTKKLVTPRHRVNYWVNPNDYTELSRRQRTDLEQKVEVKFVSDLGYRCQAEQQQQEQLVQEAQGWFSVDERILDQARNLPMKNCKRYQEIKGGRY
jgi:DnaJ family protein B protein 12